MTKNPVYAKRCLVISVSGIGNTILQSPLITKILESSLYEVDCLFGNEAMASVFAGDKRIHNTFILPKTLTQAFALFAKLLSKHYEVIISCFPSNRPQFHLLPFLICGKKRIIHDYGSWNCRFSFLSNVKITAHSDLHDVMQNLNLLRPMGIDQTDNQVKLTFRLTTKDKIHADQLAKTFQLKSSDRILGIHPGAGPLKGKRWALEKYATVATELLREGIFNKVLIFGGEEEEQIKRRLQKRIGEDRSHVVKAPLSVTAALIKHCTLFLSNDTGLMHIATACGITVLGIFGPTNWVRTAPFGKNAFFITPSPKIQCAPCLTYPFKASKPAFLCKKDFQCLNSISSTQVTDSIRALMSSKRSRFIKQAYTS